MRLLVLGGTKFLGRHLVVAALARGHDVTLFNRGRTEPSLFPTVERLTGDRDGDLRALEHGSWDAVLDTTGYVPRITAATAELLAPRIGRYLFVSTISVYADQSRPGNAEGSPVAALEHETEEFLGPNYGPLKALCEKSIGERLGDRATHVRPGIICGPWDPSGRFTYWVSRVAAGGAVLAPEPRDGPVQVIDARDLADWCVRLVEDNRGGTFNAVGPREPLTMELLLDACRAVSGSGAELVWAPVDRLLALGVSQAMDLPLWVVEGPHRAMFEIDGSRAFASGLSPRPIAETIADTLAWVRETSPVADRPAGLQPDRERQLLDELARA